MSDASAGLWSSSDAYEQYMGRWSRRIAPRFLDWLAVPAASSWIDIGCGTGVLSAAILGRCDPSQVVGIDPSETFLAGLRSQLRDPRFDFRQGSPLVAPHDPFGPDFDTAYVWGPIHGRELLLGARVGLGR